MTPKEIAAAIEREQGAWMIDQLGESGLVDCIWDVDPEFHLLPLEDRVPIVRAVRAELFG